MPYCLLLSSVRFTNTLNATKAFRLKTIKEFVRGNRGEILAEISEDLARLKSHEVVEDVELDVLATKQLSSTEEAPAHPVLDDVVSLEKRCLIRHLGLETTPSRQPLGAANTCRYCFPSSSAPNSTRGAKCRLSGL
ncbi:uncharacterized protein N7458_006130 [Penicillium daleae]|uniref:Uncharacterized protein n=1 Tax=Penicillium daleae TaxID=63821 RepID=A0AAD6G2N5_9EURO|nr:uncharacterized protein N7458_006130 [Penicillium daleae]KAJ5449681.1 hypothetical protein N7458_006130 [Penicillium daleae]